MRKNQGHPLNTNMDISAIHRRYFSFKTRGAPLGSFILNGSFCSILCIYNLYLNFILKQVVNSICWHRQVVVGHHLAGTKKKSHTNENPIAILGSWCLVLGTLAPRKSRIQMRTQMQHLVHTSNKMVKSIPLLQKFDFIISKYLKAKIVIIVVNSGESIWLAPRKSCIQMRTQMQYLVHTSNQHSARVSWFYSFGSVWLLKELLSELTRNLGTYDNCCLNLLPWFVCLLHFSSCPEFSDGIVAISNNATVVTPTHSQKWLKVYLAANAKSSCWSKQKHADTKCV